MPAKKLVSRRTLKSDLRKVDAHVLRPSEYRELPEITEEMLDRAVVKKGGRPRSSNPRKLITLRLPADVIEKWRATGPGWQTRMAEKLSRVPATKRRSVKSTAERQKPRPNLIRSPRTS
jgi:uncharacterized protein (DUF4415 family)